MATIYPSLISADILNLDAVIKQMDPYCQGYHLDIMDNHFVPNLTWGPLFINAIAKKTTRRMWVHLMVNNPESWVTLLDLPAGSIFSFHIESIGQNIHFINHLREKNWKVSVAVSPKTAITHIFPLLDVIDQVLIMSVEPGFPGQPFIKSVVDKMGPLIAYRASNKLSFTIGMDGGITSKNIADLVQQGVDDLAIASGIFFHQDPVGALKELQKIISKTK